MTKEEALKVIEKNKDWYHKGFAGFLFGIHEQAMGIASASKSGVKYALEFSIGFLNCSRHGYLDWFWDYSEMKRNRKLIIKGVLSGEYDFYDVFRKFNIFYEDYLNYFNSINTNFAEFTIEEIRNVIAELHRLIIPEVEVGYVADNFLTAGENDWLAEILKNEFGDRLDSEILESLTRPAFVSFVSDFEQKLGKLSLAIKSQVSKDNIRKAAENLCHEYYWVRSNYEDHFPLTPEDIIKEAGTFTLGKDKFDGSNNTETVKQNIKNKEKIFGEFRVSVSTRKIIDLSEKLAEIQDKRKECVLRHNTVCLSLIDKLAELLSVKNEILLNSTYDEIIEIIDTGIVKDELKQRPEKCSAYFSADGKTQTIESSTLMRFPISHFFEVLDYEKIIKGTVAFRGKVKGRVRVLFNSRHIDSFKEGEILVTNQTTPEFVPAMKKSVAVVTDQGGVTCHAAIISRELKIPCIVGTKNATRVLKDGDMVEVDAEKGVVKIIR